MDLARSVPKKTFETYLTGDVDYYFIFSFEMKNTRVNFSEFRDARREKSSKKRISFYRWNVKIDFQTDYDRINRR